MAAEKTPDTVANLDPNFINEEISKPINKYSLKAVGPTVTKNYEDASNVTIPERKTEHIKIYQSIYAYYSWLGLWFGAETKYSWKRYRSPLLWIINFLLVLCNYCILYNTAYDHFRKGEYGRMLEPLSCIGICFTCTIKWAVYLKYMNTVLALIFAVRKICEDITSGPKADILRARLEKTYRLIRIYTVGLSGVIIFYVSVAMKFFLIDGIHYLLMPVNMPFCESETLKGYLIMLAIQSVFGIYSAIATLTFGTSFLILLGNYGLMADLVEFDITELNNMWTLSSETSVAYRHEFLNNIARKLQDMQFYMSEIKRIYELKFFAYFLISYVGQVICLYQIIQKNWLPGYTPLFTVFIEMSFYCGIGTQISILGEKMCSFIQETDWYLYDQYTQKTLRFLLEMCQRPCEISLQSLGPLNMVTGVAIVKGIYYYYTVLTEMM